MLYSHLTFKCLDAVQGGLRIEDDVKDFRLSVGGRLGLLLVLDGLASELEGHELS